MRKVVLIYMAAIALLSSISATAQNRYRYWFDTPDNIENAVYGTITPSSDFNISLDASSLNPSIHTLSFQIENENGSWGDIRTGIFIRTVEQPSNEAQNIKVFVDQTQFAQYPVSSGSETFTLDFSELNPGIHYVDLYLATTSGNLHPFGGGIVVKTPTLPADPVALIIYIDGNEYETYAAANLDKIVNIDLSGLDTGYHSVFAVVEDSHGSRFPVDEREFYWEGIKASEILLDITSQSLFEGETLKLTATVLPDNTSDKTVLWNSSEEGVASVDSAGCVTAISVGSAIITATCGDASAQCSVTVTEKASIQSIDFDNVSPIHVYTLQGVYMGKFFNAGELAKLTTDTYIIKYKDKFYKVRI